MVVIICAMEREAGAIIDALEQKDIEWNKQPQTAVIGQLDGQKVLVMVSNAGKVNAAAATVQAYFSVKPSVILNIGACGALTDGYKQGDIVVPQEFIQYDIDTTDIGDPPFFMSGLCMDQVHADCRGQLFADAIKRSGMKAKRPLICATGDSFIGTGEVRQMVYDLTGADICDMEAGAIAQVCCLYGIPFASAKIVSDGKDDSAKDYEDFMQDTPQKILALARAGVAEYCKRGDG